MAALSGKIGIQRTCGTRSPVCLNVRVTQTFSPGSLVAHRLGSNLAEAISADAPRADLVIVGCANHYLETVGDTADGNGAAIRDVDTGDLQSVFFDTGIIGYLDTGSGANAITALDVGKPCFAYDDNTVYKTDLSGQLSFAGIVDGVDANGKVRIKIDARAGLHALFGAADTADQVAVTRYARGAVLANVADLAAFAVAGNNGLTYAQGDRVLLTAQTTAAQCGLYVVGEVAAGVAPLTRAPDMPSGLVLPPGVVVQTGSGQTEYNGAAWKAMTTQSGGATIGTHDPLFYPQHFRMKVTLASGTYTIGAGSTATPDEALFLAATANVQATRNTVGGTVTSTIMYAAADAGRTAGKVGTAALVVNAVVAAGTVNSADTSTVDVLVTNW